MSIVVTGIVTDVVNLIANPVASDDTPEEPWYWKREPSHWYAKQADFALSSLGSGPGSCLVIGSPLFEAKELAQAGWDVTYVDVRKPPATDGLKFIQGDAGALDFGSGFDCASSTCVLCHAGLGRYGDPMIERGDEAILKNVLRSLKVGGLFAVTFGPVFTFDVTVRYSRVHRVYSLPEARKMTTGFRIREEKILDTRVNDWVPGLNTDKILDINYLSMLLEKV